MRNGKARHHLKKNLFVFSSFLKKQTPAGLLFDVEPLPTTGLKVSLFV